MCTGLEILPLILAAGGTAATTIAQQRAMSKQDEEAARGIMRQAELSREASQKVGENIEQFEASTPEGERVAALNDFTAALKRSQAQPGADALAAPAGATSERFAEDVGAARSANAAESRGLAERTARIDAPSFQRLREGQSSADLASNLGMIEGRSQAEDFLTRLRASSHQPNPFVTGIGGGLASFGNAMAGRALPLKKKPPIKTGTVMDAPNINPAGPRNA